MASDVSRDEEVRARRRHDQRSSVSFRAPSCAAVRLSGVPFSRPSECGRGTGRWTDVGRMREWKWLLTHTPLALADRSVLLSLQRPHTVPHDHAPPVPPPSSLFSPPHRLTPLDPLILRTHVFRARVRHREGPGRAEGRDHYLGTRSRCSCLGDSGRRRTSYRPGKGSSPRSQD
ncbi:hypothetical protein BJY59DRAFT_282315 [Rhodotorula toruloides]